MRIYTPGFFLSIFFEAQIADLIRTKPVKSRPRIKNERTKMNELI